MGNLKMILTNNFFKILQSFLLIVLFLIGNVVVDIVLRIFHKGMQIYLGF